MVTMCKSVDVVNWMELGQDKYYWIARVNIALNLCYISQGVNWLKVGLGGLGVPCSPRDIRLAGANPGEVDGFFQDVKILSTSPPGGTLSWGSRA